jgi:quinol monooxygenase YgiN
VRWNSRNVPSEEEANVTGFAMTVEVDSLKRYELLQALEAGTASKSCPDGCVECHVYEEVGKPGNLMLMSLWEDAALMQEHLKSDRFRGVKGAVDVLGRLVRFDVFEN